jgi:hypothetical protein
MEYVKYIFHLSETFRRYLRATKSPLPQWVQGSFPGFNRSLAGVCSLLLCSAVVENGLRLFSTSIYTTMVQTVTTSPKV